MNRREIIEARNADGERLTQTLAAHEAVIEKAGADALAAFVVIGSELDAIRADRSYLATHATFDEYTRERWSFSASRARQLIRAANAVTAGNAPGAVTEREVRALLAATIGTTTKKPVSEFDRYMRETYEREEAEQAAAPVPVPGTLDADVPPSRDEMIYRSYLNRLAEAGWNVWEEWESEDDEDEAAMLSAFVAAGLRDFDIHRVFQMNDGDIPLEECRRRFGYVVFGRVNWLLLGRVLSLLPLDYALDRYVHLGVLTRDQADGILSA